MSERVRYDSSQFQFLLIISLHFIQSTVIFDKIIRKLEYFPWIIEV